MVPRAILTSGVATVSSLAVLESWRASERDRFRKKAETLASIGSVKCRGSNRLAKQVAWESYLPHLLGTWEQASGGSFNLGDESTWPNPASGRAYAFTHTGKDDYPLRLVDDHYEAQAVTAAFVESSLDGRVHWGNRTHWKLRLLLSPWWAPVYVIHSALLPDKEAIRLDGPNNAWGLAVFPAEKTTGSRASVAGASTPGHAHFDGGRAAVFHEGLPYPSSAPAEDSTAEDPVHVPVVPVDEALMHLVASQITIQFHCCTPGDLGSEHGVTGLYDGSHLLVSAALQKVFLKEGGVLLEGETTKNMQEEGRLQGGHHRTLSNSFSNSNDSDAGKSTSDALMVRKWRADGSALVPWSSVAAALKAASCPRVASSTSTTAGDGVDARAGATERNPAECNPAVKSDSRGTAHDAQQTTSTMSPPPTTPFSPLPSSSSSPPPSPPPLSPILDGLLRQPVLEDGSILLVAGTLVHGTMRAVEPMQTPGGSRQPRVIMNGKSFVAAPLGECRAGAVGARLHSFTDLAPAGQSLAKRTALEPRTLWVKTGRDGADFDKRVDHLTSAILSTLV